MLLPTSVVGSHGLPGWVWLAREAMEAGRLGALDPPRRLGQPLWDTNTPFEVAEPVAAPDGLGIVEEWKLARSLTTKRVKATVPGPYTLLVPLKLGGGYRDRETLLADLVAIVNAECRALVAAGCDFIQIDEPHTGMYAGSAPRFDLGVNRAVEGVDAKIAVHVCFGNLYGRPFAAVRDFRRLYGALADLTASQIVLEYANRGMEDLPLWREVGPDKELGVGVVDVKAFRAETPEEVAERIRAALRHVPAERLWITPDCGFWETPRWIVKRKLAALVEGARIVRRELAR